MTDERRRLIGYLVLALGGLLFVIGLITVVTSDDDGDTDSAPADAETPATEDASTSSSTSTTTTSTTTTTTTTAPPDEALEAARAAVGTYEGQWVNTTFGSTGPIAVTVTLDEATRVVTITADLGGNVFGGSDPPPITIDVDIDAAGGSFSSPLFGDVTVSIDDGDIMLTAENIPAPGIARMTVTGTADPGGSDLAYMIEFDDGSGAEGTASLGAVNPPEATDDDPPPDDPPPEPTPTDETVADFFTKYVDAINRGDVDFLLERLHPVVLAQPTADLCRAFIEREILELEDYRLTGEVTGPVAQTIAGSDVSEVYSAPVAFDFQGQSFEATAVFAAVDGQMRWFTECR